METENNQNENIETESTIVGNVQPVTVSKENAQIEKFYKKTIFKFFIKLFIFIVVILITFNFVFGLYIIDGEAMFPKLRDGDFILYSRINNDYNIDEAVVYESNGIYNVSRVIAKQGDVIDLNYNGKITINGNIKNEEIFYDTKSIAGGIKYPYKVPENSYFLMSDFRTSASDSRLIGAISKKDIKGKIVTLIRMRSF